MSIATTILIALISLIIALLSAYKADSERSKGWVKGRGWGKWFHLSMYSLVVFVLSFLHLL